MHAQMYMDLVCGVWCMCMGVYTCAHMCMHAHMYIDLEAGSDIQVFPPPYFLRHGPSIEPRVCSGNPVSALQALEFGIGCHAHPKFMWILECKLWSSPLLSLQLLLPIFFFFEI